MIITTNAWKKMLKSSAKNGVIIAGREGEWLFVSDGHWVVNVMCKTLNKKELAAFIEVVGKLPEEGEYFKIADDELNPMDKPEAIMLPVKKVTDLVPIKTGICFDDMGTLLRCYQRSDNLEAKWYPEIQINAVNESELYKAQNESVKFGFYGTQTDILIWRNATSAYGVTRMMRTYKELDELLGGVDISELTILHD